MHIYRMRRPLEAETARRPLGELGRQEQFAHVACTSGCEPVALASRHNRSLHQHMPFTGEVIRVGDAGSRGQGTQEDPDVGQMRRGCPSHGTRLEHLEKNVDEGASLEVVVLEPFVKDVENRKQAVAGGSGPACDRLSRKARTRSSLERK